MWDEPTLTWEGENGTPCIGSRKKTLSMQGTWGKWRLQVSESRDDTWNICRETNGRKKPCVPQMPQGEWLLKIATVVVMKVSLFGFEGYRRLVWDECYDSYTYLYFTLLIFTLTRVFSSCAGDKLRRTPGPVQNKSSLLVYSTLTPQLLGWCPCLWVRVLGPW